MPVINRIAALSEEIALWRRDIHRHPELGFQELRTAGVVADKLRAFGCDEVVPGIGKTGVVGVIRGNRPGTGKARVIGLRADMDALPIEEATGLSYQSQSAGRMHACGHDGHTSMLLGAAKYLAETRNFAGTAVLIFQPAEEGGGGGREMVNEGMMERFGIEEVFGLHNKPGLPVGAFELRPGPFMAAADRFTVEITGKGAHAAYPQLSVDPIVAGCQIVTALQSIVARNVDPVKSAVVSVTVFEAGTAHNIIPNSATLKGTVRTFDAAVQDMIEARLRTLVDLTAKAHGATANIDYQRYYPATINHEAQTRFAAAVAAEVAGEARVSTNAPLSLGAEDFSFMLNARPGAMIWMGNGDTAGLHHPAYDFNDAAIPVGASYWARLVETAMGG